MSFAALIVRAPARVIFALAMIAASDTALGQTVSVIRNFNDGVNESSFAPPDSDGTVGPNDFLEFINSRFIVFDKTTSHTKRLDITDSAFWQGVNNPQSVSAGLTDTHVIYDYNSQRYFAVEITEDTTNNKVLIARTNSAGADPTVLSNWTATSYTGRTSNFADFPMVGIDANALYISTNNFRSSGSFRDVTLTTLPKSDLLLSTPSVANKSFINSTTPGFSPQPVVDFSATKGAGEFIGVPLTINNSTNLIYTRVTGTAAAGASFQSAVNITVPSFNVPTNQGAQPDGTFQLDDGDGRMPYRGYQVGNDVWLVQAVKGTGGATSRSAVEWYRVNYNGGGTPSLISSGLLQDTAGHFDYFNPSIAANVNGDVVISVTRSGDSTTGTAGRAGAYAFVGFTSGTTTSFGSATLLQAGLTNGYHLFGGSDERWGDYSSVTVDPNDQGDFWLINEYAVSSSSWANNIAALSVLRTVIWSGAGGDNNWSTKPDWDYLPTNDDSLVFAGTTRLSNTNNSLSRVGSITFNNTAGAFTFSGNALTIAGDITNSSSSAQTINLNLTLGAALQFNAASGNLTVNGTVANGGNSLTVTGSSNTTLSGAISGSGRLVKTGAGLLSLSGDNSYSGGTTVSAGTLTVGHVHGLGSGGLTINNTAKTTLQAGLTAPVQLPSLTLQGGAAPTATLDITDNNLIVHNGNLATLTAQIKSGFNLTGALWTGAGITSSTAATDSSSATAVGIILNNNGGGGTIYSTWPVGADSGGAVAVTNTDVLMKYTYYGDANLSGVVDNTSDYSLWASGFTSGGSLGGWLYGDFNYDGVVDNTVDYSLWATGFTSGGGPLDAGGVQPVPEPSTLVLAALGLGGVATMLRRRQTSAT